MARPTRTEKHAATTSALLRAAAETFAERGFEGATMDEIAERVGLSKGPLYYRYETKEDLFLAVFEEHIARRLQATEEALAPSASTEERRRAGADEWMQFLGENPDWFPLFIEFWLKAVRDPELRRRFAARYRRFSEANTSFLREAARELDIELPPEVAKRAGVVITALADGLALLKLADPAAVPDDLFGNVLSLLLRPERLNPEQPDSDGRSQPR